MKKNIFILVCMCLYMVGVCAASAVTIKKASSVATKKTSAVDSASTLVPTVLGLVGAVKELSAKQTELTKECTPTQAEVDWVNRMLKEWIQTGAMTKDDVITSKGLTMCTSGPCYKTNIQEMMNVDGTPQWSDGFGDEGSIWYGYPMATVATYCNTEPCTTKNNKSASNIWTMFSLIDFAEEDYSASEATMAAKLRDKYEKCSEYALGGKQKLLQQEFLMNTVGSVGQQTNTGSIMQVVGGLGGNLSDLGSIGNLAIQFLDK